MTNRAVCGSASLAGSALVLAALLLGCGGGSGGQAPGGPLVELPTRRCPTEIPPSFPQPDLGDKTPVAIPPAVAGELAAYRDAAGTTLVAPRGWECEAGIGTDHSERLNAFPPGQEDPAEPPFHPGEVVSLQLYTTCSRCIAEYACALFPTAKVVKKYGVVGSSHCPAGGLDGQVTRVSPSTAVFLDPPGLKGTGAGSGGRVRSVGAMSLTEAAGMRKVSCTLSPGLAHLCAASVGATMLGTPPPGTS